MSQQNARMPAGDLAPRQSNYTILAILLAVLVVGGGLVYWFFLRNSPDRRELPALTQEAREYTRHLKLSEDTSMKATENFMQAMVVEVTGSIKNNGNRSLKLVELNCVFRDPNGEVLLRERVPIVRSRGKGFSPGETRSFRLPFDSVSQGWNQIMPDLIIARIEFEN